MISPPGLRCAESESHATRLDNLKAKSPLGGYDNVRIETQTKISELLQRLFRELKITNPKVLLSPAASAFCHAIVLVKFPHVESFLPGARDPVVFAAQLEIIFDPTRFQSMLAELPEPDPYKLEEAIREVMSWPRLLKHAMTAGAKQISPTGGPTEKLADLSKVGNLTDEVFQRLARGEGRKEILEDLARREAVSVTTVIRRLEEEMERRRIMLEISKAALA